MPVSTMRARMRTSQGRRKHRRQKSPWTAPELERLLASARATPGEVGAKPARAWWPAFLLALVDTGAFARDLLRVTSDDFDRRVGRVRVGLFAYQLHATTIEALGALRGPSEAPGPLFEWRGDHSLLFSDFRKILYRANLPPVTHNLLDRLRVTALHSPDILDLVDPRALVALRTNEFREPKARERHPAAAPPGKPSRRPRSLLDVRPDVVLIANDSPRSLRRFLREEYAPRRLAAGKPNTVECHVTAINRFALYCGCEPTIDQLTDDRLEEFTAWAVRAGTGAAVVNKALRFLVAQWNYAWRRRKTDVQPRKIDGVPCLSRLPEAWRPEQFSAILSAAAALEGMEGRTPARIFWPAILLTLYDTGLRIGALLALEPAAFDPAKHSLTVPAENQKHRSEQSFVLHSQTTELLAQVVPICGKLFAATWNGRPVKDAYVTLKKRYRLLLQRCGLPRGSRDLFHKIRRTTATRIANATNDRAAQEQLGHSTVALTRRNYIDPRQVERRFDAANTIKRPEWTPTFDVPSLHSSPPKQGDQHHGAENRRF